MTDRQLIADLLSALEYHTEQTRPINFSKVAIEAAREYLRKPAQRTWVGLTDEKIAKVVSLAGFAPDWVKARIAIQIVRVLEAELKRMNT